MVVSSGVPGWRSPGVDQRSVQSVPSGVFFNSVQGLGVQHAALNKGSLVRPGAEGRRAFSSPRRATTTMRAPSRRSCRAMARPSPLLAPGYQKSLLIKFEVHKKRGLCVKVQQQARYGSQGGQHYKSDGNYNIVPDNGGQSFLHVDHGQDRYNIMDGNHIPGCCAGSLQGPRPEPRADRCTSPLTTAPRPA